MQSNPFPYYEINTLSDGVLCKAPKYCLNRLKKKKQSCLDFHNQVFKEGEFVTCPEGFRGVYVSDRMYIPLLTEKTDISKIKNKLGEDKINFIFEEGVILMLNTISNNISVSNALNDMLHDIKKLNGYMLDLLSFEDESADEKSKNKFETMKQWNYLMKSRLNLYDVSQDSFFLSQGKKVDKHIYKLFDAIKKSFESIENDTGKNIRIYSNARIEYNISVYNSFQLLPFVLLDNAVKYSPSKCTIDINFNMMKDRLEITISSMGPKPNQLDLGQLVKRGYRGTNPMVQKVHGSGLGLSIAKEICDLNNIIYKYDFENVVGNEKLCKFINIIEIPKNHLKLIEE